ncbi:MAG: DUF4062 domain-containing protein [Gammaproteobacteria bacterium]|nr:DUF4062 domain-containing protein [Gammaproteobacteria bacterium]
MITLNKKTLVSTSIGTLMAAAGGLWVVAGEFNEAVAQINLNATSIKSLEIRSIDSELASLRKERRALNRELREYPEDPVIMEDLEAVDDEITDLVLIRECLVDPEIEVCR